MIRLSHPTGIAKETISLPNSKSIANRMLVLRKLYKSNLAIEQLSNANDTIVLSNLLESENEILDVQDAGTVFRFLVAYCSVTNGTRKLSGTNRLNERPIKRLVKVLRDCGAKIKYLEKEGFAPLEITGKQLEFTSEIVDFTEVKSSQFVSAFLMITPKIKGDFKIKVNPSMNSLSYVQMTLECMQQFGFSFSMDKGLIELNGYSESAIELLTVEPDWSAFYYWFAIAHLAKKVELKFPGLKLSNIQQDSAVLGLISNTCLEVRELEDGLLLLKEEEGQIELETPLNLAQFPDLAPTFSHLLAALKVQMQFTGLESLEFKECDRDLAIKENLKLLNVEWLSVGDNWKLDAKEFSLLDGITFETYQDHRMAMCVAPLALVKPIKIQNPEVVSKSYPNFWSDLESAGFKIEYL